MSGAYYKARGEDLGWISLNNFGYPLQWAGQVSSLRAGQTGAPFLVDGRYYIVRCLEGPDYEPWPLNEVQDQVKADLMGDQLHAAFAHILAQQEQHMSIVLLDQRYGMVLQNFEQSLYRV